MDVRCTRCGTEYEFDDALIAERGTSVRCTQCGFQFKVFPPKFSSVGPDEWVVLTSLGRKVVYRSLRELQNGISKSEVAREDLLARGSKPPRPLGSIAELDPLFATKAGPERQPSTLTGVAPPPEVANKVGPPMGGPGRKGHDTFSGVAPPPQTQAGSIPPPGGSLGREGHDTFSGVAPPPNSPDGGSVTAGNAEVRPAPPLRVGGTRTVLGIGVNPPQETARPDLPQQSVLPIEMPSRAAEVVPVDSTPPETRSYESIAPDDDARIQLDASSLLTDPPARPTPTTDVESTPRQEVTAPLPRHETELGVAVPSSRATSAIEDEPSSDPPTRGRTEELERTAPVGEKPLAKVQLTTKAVPVLKNGEGASDPPTARWAGAIIEENPRVERDDAAVVRHAPSAPQRAEQKLGATAGSSERAILSVSATAGASTPAQLQTTASAVPQTARSVELVTPERPKPESAQPSPAHDAATTRAVLHSTAKHGAATTKQIVVEAAAPHATEPAKDSLIKGTPPRATDPTKQPVKRAGGSAARVHAQSTSGLEAASIPPKPLLTPGRVATAVALLGLGVFAGMKIVGSQMTPKPHAVPAPSARALASSSLSHAVASADSVAATATLSSIAERLLLGDHAAADRLLSELPPSERSSLPARELAVRASALAADMAWWEVQLVGKGAGDAYVQAKSRLSERLERLKTEVAAFGSETSSPVLAASLDARRMQGEKLEPTLPILVERVKQSESPDLKYTQLVLAWVRAGQPDESTVDGLTRLRAAPTDLGPRPVALVMALTQLNRIGDAKAELARSAAQAPPHPLVSAMQAYVAKAEQASHAEAHPDAGSPESASNDADLVEGDFRLRLTRASECLSRNELTRAQKLLRSVLAERPNDTEAITALADVHRRRGDVTQSRNLYDKALALNGNYLPAMSGAADLRWRAGDRAGAAALYRRILDRVGETPGYGQVAAARLKEMEGATKPANDATNSPTSTDPPAARDGKVNAPKSGTRVTPKEQP